MIRLLVGKYEYETHHRCHGGFVNHSKQIIRVPGDGSAQRRQRPATAATAATAVYRVIVNIVWPETHNLKKGASYSSISGALRLMEGAAYSSIGRCFIQDAFGFLQKTRQGLFEFVICEVV